MTGFLKKPAWKKKKHHVTPGWDDASVTRSADLSLCHQYGTGTRKRVREAVAVYFLAKISISNLTPVAGSARICHSEIDLVDEY